MPGRPATDQQMRMYMAFRHHHSQCIAAAKTGISERTGRRIEGSEIKHRADTCRHCDGAVEGARTARTLGQPDARQQSCPVSDT